MLSKQCNGLITRHSTVPKGQFLKGDAMFPRDIKSSFAWFGRAPLLLVLLLQGCAGAGALIGGAGSAIISSDLKPDISDPAQAKYNIVFPQSVKENTAINKKLLTDTGYPVQVITTGFLPLYYLNDKRGCGASLMFADRYPFSSARFKQQEAHLRTLVVKNAFPVKYGSSFTKDGQKISYLICIDYTSPRSWGNTCENYSFDYRFYVMAAEPETSFPARRGNTCSLLDYDPTGYGELIYASHIKTVQGSASDYTFTPKDGKVPNKDESEFYAQASAYVRASINIASDINLQASLKDYLATHPNKALPATPTKNLDSTLVKQCKELGFTEGKDGFEKCLAILNK